MRRELHKRSREDSRPHSAQISFFSISLHVCSITLLAVEEMSPFGTSFKSPVNSAMSADQSTALRRSSKLSDVALVGHVPNELQSVGEVIHGPMVPSNR